MAGFTVFGPFLGRCGGQGASCQRGEVLAGNSLGGKWRGASGEWRAVRSEGLGARYNGVGGSWRFCRGKRVGATRGVVRPALLDQPVVAPARTLGMDQLRGLPTKR